MFYCNIGLNKPVCAVIVFPSKPNNVSTSKPIRLSNVYDGRPVCPSNKSQSKPVSPSNVCLQNPSAITQTLILN